ncbi:hypothetical protein [Dysgonomonas termitidis]|uniref:Uncharacterized protein n=1 Tax=Dysgonomonas termitidis TaxID=1516126 RepID=A0ABV9KTV0_9BACT
MGLDTTHECWHGPYSSFNDFRKKLCSLIGLDIDQFCGYNNNAPGCVLMSRHTIPHGIYPLINHSDCDGVLFPYESESIVEGLNDILEKHPGLKDDDPYFYNKIIQFRDGCIKAVNKEETIEFK